MPFDQRFTRGKPSKRTIARLAENSRASFRPGPGATVSQVGGHQQIGTRPRVGPYGGSGTTLFRAKITGHATLASGSAGVGGGSAVTVAYKWKYAWTEVEPTGDTVQNVTGGRSGTTTVDYAINEAEEFHTASLSWGETITDGDYPTGSRPKAVGGANPSTDQTVHSYDVIVWMEEVVEVGSGLTKYRFNKQWYHSGGCT